MSSKTQDKKSNVAAQTVAPKAVLSECKPVSHGLRAGIEAVKLNFPAVDFVVNGETFHIASPTLAKAAAESLVRQLSADTAGRVSDEKIREVLQTYAEGYLGLRDAKQAKAKALASVGTKQGAKKNLFTQAQIELKLGQLGFDQAARTIAGMDAEKFGVVYQTQLGNEGSKIYAAHAALVADAELEAATKAQELVADVDMEEL